MHIWMGRSVSRRFNGTRGLDWASPSCLQPQTVSRGRTIPSYWLNAINPPKAEGREFRLRRSSFMAVYHLLTRRVLWCWLGMLWASCLRRAIGRSDGG